MIDEAILDKLKHDWQSGLLKPRLLSIRYNLAVDVIESLAAKHGWGVHGRLHDKIDTAATHALMDRAISSQEASNAVTDDPQNGANGVFVDETEQIAKYAQIVAGVVEAQRSDIKRGRELAGKQLRELEELAPPEVDQNAIDSLARAVEQYQPNLAHWLRSAVGPQTHQQKLMFLRNRIEMLGRISITQETYVGMEREAWGLNSRKDPGGGLCGAGVDELIDVAREQLNGGGR